MKTFIGFRLPSSFGKCCYFSLFILLSSFSSSYAFYHAAPDNKAISVKTSASSLAAYRLARARAIARKAELKMISLEAFDMFREMQLEDSGLNEKALEYALIGYHHLLKKGILHRTDVLSICDFSQSSRRRRMYVIDLENKKVLVNTYVAHGRRSGGEYARSFSNNPSSHKSSLGFYITEETYFGKHGLSLKIHGLEKGFNDKADRRNIVIHGSRYVGENFLKSNSFNGRSFGCPAIPLGKVDDVIDEIKGGSCLFIYYPEKKYLHSSKILNG